MEALVGGTARETNETLSNYGREGEDEQEGHTTGKNTTTWRWQSETAGRPEEKEPFEGQQEGEEEEGATEEEGGRRRGEKKAKGSGHTKKNHTQTSERKMNDGKVLRY